MGSASNAFENKILDHIFKNTAWGQPTNIYIALCKSTIDDTHTGSTLPTEVSGGSYARKVCNTWDVAASGATENSQAVTFTQASADWGVVTDYAILDHLTTGTVIGYGKLNTTKNIQNGDTAEFATGAIDVTFD
jgi:hypothetical protein